MLTAKVDFTAAQKKKTFKEKSRDCKRDRIKPYETMGEKDACLMRKCTWILPFKI